RLFIRSYVHAMGCRGPHRLRLRLKPDGLGVGHPVTKLRGFATPDIRWVGVKTEYRHLLSAVLLDGNAVLLMLLFRTFLRRLPFDVPPVLPPREHNKHNR